MSDHQEYREWAAAYVLGALEPGEVTEFEAHLAECAECRAGVVSFAPIPALLGRLDSLELEAPPPRIEDRAIAKVQSEWGGLNRSRRRWRVAAGIAATAAVIALTILALRNPTTPAGIELPLDPGSTASGQIVLEERAWGTAIDIELANMPDRDHYVAWAVARDGTWEQVAAWGATPGAGASVSGASSIPTNQLASIVITDVTRTETIATARMGDG